MRNAIVSLAFSTLFSMTSMGLSQTIVENPAKPDNPLAGRVVIDVCVGQCNGRHRAPFYHRLSRLTSAADLVDARPAFDIVCPEAGDTR